MRRFLLFFYIWLQILFLSENSLLAKDSTELPPPEYFLALKAVKGEDPNQILSALKYLKDKAYEETGETAMARAYYDLSSTAQTGKLNITILQAALEVLYHVGSANEVEMMNELVKSCDRIFEKYDQYHHQIRPMLMKTLQALQSRPTPPPSAMEIMAQYAAGNPHKPLPLPKNDHSKDATKQSQPQAQVPKESSQNKEQEAHKILGDRQKWLEHYTIGQPEVIEGLMRLELRNAVYGNQRNTPEVFVFMGLPGTGKDTAAENYLDAIFARRGAHLEHLFPLPVVKTEMELSQILGSGTGYVGSNNLPPILEFLVRHSGGRYQLVEGEEKTAFSSKKSGEVRVVENPDWRPGVVLDGYFGPEQGALFINEFHDWNRNYKNQFLKQLMEKGLFQIRNPNGGLSQIYVPITIFIATNDGLNLVTSREPNGQRFGKPLTYDQMMEKWKRVYDDKDLLKDTLKGTASNRSPYPTGTSEEMLSRIPKRNLFLMRPLSPEDLRGIANLKLSEMARHLAKANGFLGSIFIRWDDQVLRVIQEYHYNAEESARPIQDNVISMIETTLFEAIASKKINADSDGKVHVQLEIQKLPDNSHDLILKTAQSEPIRVPIAVTLHDKHLGEMEESRIDELSLLPERMKSRIFGMDKLLERLGRSVLVAEEGRNAQDNGVSESEPAQSFLFLGLSSTGKTETAKALAEVFYGVNDAVVTIDFSQVQSMEALKIKILGSRDSEGNAIPSDFMKEYDRRQGRVLFVLDEVANAPRDVLKGLYDILREATVTTFSDNKPRRMSNVTIIATGNAGEEIYKAIPKNIPLHELMMAMRQVYDQFIKKPAAQRALLGKYFSEAFINRFGLQNIFFFPPLSFQAIRELTQAKLQNAISNLEPVPGRRGWYLEFATQELYLNFLDLMETEAFEIQQQGASIDKYIREQLRDFLRTAFLKSKIPSLSKVTLAEISVTPKEFYLKFTYQSNGISQTLDLTMERRYQPKKIRHNQTDRIITAYHEAGHEIVREVVFREKFAPSRVTILPGVTEIGGQWIRYLGLSKSDEKEYIEWNRENVVKQIAVLAGGGVAERLVTQSEVNTAGVSNDIERASAIAQNAVLKWGLSKKWGWKSTSKIEELNEKQREQLAVEVKQLLEEGIALANRSLLANFEGAFLPLGYLLSEKGDLKRDDLNQFYSHHPIINSSQRLFSVKSWLVRSLLRWHGFLWKFRFSKEKSELKPVVPRPKEIADLDGIVARERRQEIEKVKISEKIRFGEARRCENAFRSRLADVPNLRSNTN